MDSSPSSASLPRQRPDHAAGTTDQPVAPPPAPVAAPAVPYTRCLLLVADAARYDVMRQLLEAGELPNLQRHVVERGCFRRALTVFPSTTGPAHIPFVAGVHPGTANVPGYRWLSRTTHDARRRSRYRHRSLNNPLGLFLGADLDAERTATLFEYFEAPSAILEPVDLCRTGKIYRVVLRRLLYVLRAHLTSDWAPVDRLVERLVERRIRDGSACIVATFFGIDEYSHLYGPFDGRALEAYRQIDAAVGRIAAVLQEEGLYDETVVAVLSDHGQTPTAVHIPVVDLLKGYRFDPHYYPRLYRRRCDSAVMESGNAMAQVYFKRGTRWGPPWRFDEMEADARIGGLLGALLHTPGMAFAIARTEGGVVFAGPQGRLHATDEGEAYRVTVEGAAPLPGHPEGRIGKGALFEWTFDALYPDAVHQAFLFFRSERAGDLVLCSEPGYDLRLEHEHPEHRGSHGSLHAEHMHVPLALSVPVEEEFVRTADVMPTILALTGKTPVTPFDGRALTVSAPRAPAPPIMPEAEAPAEEGGAGLSVGITIAIILAGIAITALFQDEIFGFGEGLMRTYGQGTVDAVLFLLTAVSSTPLALPIWGYALVGVAMGYDVLRLAAVMALGSASGGVVTYVLGRYFGRRPWVRRKFPNLHKHPWAHGRSRAAVTLLLFLGTASPIPCDVFYAACGVKRYPVGLFWATMVAARFVRYCYLGYGFDLFYRLYPSVGMPPQILLYYAN